MFIVYEDGIEKNRSESENEIAMDVRMIEGTAGYYMCEVYCKAFGKEVLIYRKFEERD